MCVCIYIYIYILITYIEVLHPLPAALRRGIDERQLPGDQRRPETIINFVNSNGTVTVL